MNDMGEQMVEVKLQSALFREALKKGELQWEDEIIQFFIPLALHFTDFDWLKLIAENNLVKEDEIVVKNFLDMVQALIQVNEENLELAVKAKIKRLFGEL